MLIYQNTTEKFKQDVRENTISDMMVGTFRERLGRQPGYAEVNSWQNSLSRVRDLIELADLTDNRIALEYEVPYNANRIDCLLFGRGQDERENVVLIELKQWQSVEAVNQEGNFVETYTGGGERIVPHPSQQVEGYHHYLRNFVEAFEKQPPLLLFSCSYCHNYKKEEGRGLFAPQFKKLVEDYPIYTQDSVKALADRIKRLLAKGEGFEIFNRFMQSPIRPSQKLLDNVCELIENKAVFSLLNEQLVAKNLIWNKIKKAAKTKTKSAVIVHGGPGTGKSLIAINILAEAAKKGYSVFYGCKSKPFTEGLRHLVGGDGRMLFSNLYRFIPTKVKANELDLILVDEAHRIEKNSNFQYTRTKDRSDMPQVEQLVRCAKVAVFFIDDKQNVRSQEIGSSELIREAARKYKCNLEEAALETQFRCMGSNDYLLWLESVLGYTGEEKKLRKEEIFEFKIFDSPKELYRALAEKEKEKPNSARLTAGFCWPWSKELDENGELVKDVKIGDFAMPWETHGDITRTPEGYVKWYEWAYKPEGFKQVGCIYTAQGFEFDYIGVIIGKDLIYDSTNDKLKADISATKDPKLLVRTDQFETYVRNIYRTLLSRGMKGCYVHFMDKDTERFFRSRMEGEAVKEEQKVITLIPDDDPRVKQAAFKTLLPVYSLKAVAGYFGNGVAADKEGWVEVSGKLDEKMFVAKVNGKSMEPNIPDGSYCVFRANPEGTREGKIVLAQYQGLADPETGGSYTVKIYHSEKKKKPDEEGRNESVTLKPINKAFKPIELAEENQETVKIIAEWVGVINKKRG